MVVITNWNPANPFPEVSLGGGAGIVWHQVQHNTAQRGPWR
jgi:hypothetical protein